MELTSSRPCPDPECGGLGEPEQDGDHTYCECTTCGYAFDYQRLAAVAVAPDGTSCAAGIPEHLRRAASAPVENTLAATRPPLLLQIGRRPDGPAA